MPRARKTTKPVPAHLSSKSDNWPTPQDLFDALDAEFGFVLDVCASTTNHKAASFYALDHPDAARRDGLARDWAADAAELDGGVWMNPPYGKAIPPWMAKAFATAQAGATVVTLVPVRADTVWWHEHVLATGAEVRFIKGRLTFGDAENTAAFASAVVIYRPTDIPGAPGPVATMPAHPAAPSRRQVIAAPVPAAPCPAPVLVSAQPSPPTATKNRRSAPVRPHRPAPARGAAVLHGERPVVAATPHRGGAFPEPRRRPYRRSGKASADTLDCITYRPETESVKQVFEQRGLGRGPVAAATAARNPR